MLHVCMADVIYKALQARNDITVFPTSGGGWLKPSAEKYILINGSDLIVQVVQYFELHSYNTCVWACENITKQS